MFAAVRVVRLLPSWYRRSVAGDHPAERLGEAAVDGEGTVVGDGSAITTVAQSRPAAELQRAAADRRGTAVGIVARQRQHAGAGLGQAAAAAAQTRGPGHALTVGIDVVGLIGRRAETARIIVLVGGRVLQVAAAEVDQSENLAQRPGRAVLPRAQVQCAAADRRVAVVGVRCGECRKAAAKLLQGTQAGNHSAERLVAAGTDNQRAVVRDGCAVIAAAQDAPTADRERACTDRRAAAVSVAARQRQHARAGHGQAAAAAGQAHGPGHVLAVGIDVVGLIGRGAETAGIVVLIGGRVFQDPAAEDDRSRLAQRPRHAGVFGDAQEQGTRADRRRARVGVRRRQGGDVAAELLHGAAAGNHPAERLVEVDADDQDAAVGDRSAVTTAVYTRPQGALDLQRAAADRRGAAVAVVARQRQHAAPGLGQAAAAAAQTRGPGHALTVGIDVVCLIGHGAETARIIVLVGGRVLQVAAAEVDQSENLAQRPGRAVLPRGQVQGAAADRCVAVVGVRCRQCRKAAAELLQGAGATQDARNGRVSAARQG